MGKALTIIQVITAVIVITAVLLQQKGAGLSDVFGGSGVSYRTKRGAEKFLIFSTIVSAIIFLVATIWRILL